MKPNIVKKTNTYTFQVKNNKMKFQKIKNSPSASEEHSTSACSHMNLNKYGFVDDKDGFISQFEQRLEDGYLQT